MLHNLQYLPGTLVWILKRKSFRGPLQDIWENDQRKRIASLEEEFVTSCKSIGLSHDAAIMVQRNRVCCHHLFEYYLSRIPIRCPSYYYGVNCSIASKWKHVTLVYVHFNAYCILTAGKENNPHLLLFNGLTKC